jgi:hypothetical protein
MSERSIEERIAGTLHERATKDVPYDLDLWTRISSQAEKHRPAYRGLSRLPFGRPNLVVAAYMVVLVLAVVVTFSLAPSLKSDGSSADAPGRVHNPSPAEVVATRQAYQQMQGTPFPTITPDVTATQYAKEYHALDGPYAYLDRGKYGKYVGLDQTVGGYTVNIIWVYADGNRVLVQFKVIPPDPDPRPDKRIVPSTYAVSVLDGPLLPYSGVNGYGKAEADKYYLLDLDAANVLDGYFQQDLDFNLTMMLDAIELKPSSEDTPSDPDAAWTINSANVERIKESNVAGPFSFNFRVPFIPARIARLVQTASANDVDVSLQQFRVSPSEIRSYVKVESWNKPLSSPDWRISAGAQVNDWDAFMFRTRRPPFGQMLSDTVGRHTIFDNVYDQEGEWTFTVRQFTNDQTLETLEGPWVFKFQVPSAGTYPGNWRLKTSTPIHSR